MEPARLSVSTPARTALLPIGRSLQAEVDHWGVREGALLVSVGHTTCGLTLNEPEPGLLDDFAAALERLVPWEARYAHNRGAEDNAVAHIRAALMGHQVIVPVRDGRLDLGTWQDVLLVECDGPRTRTVRATLLG